MFKKKTRKRLSFLLTLALLIPLCRGIMPERVAEAATVLKNPRTDSDGVTTWDCVYFGNYWQEDTNGDGTADQNDAKTPIKWRVLSVDGDDVFLLADKNLDCQSYNDTDTDVTWETCTMRSWLNGYGAEENQDGKDYSDDNFLDNAFSRSEQSAISTTRVVNDDNPGNGTEGGNDTSEKVYLLSIDEVTNPAYGFLPDYSKYDKARRAKNTEYAKAQGAWTDTSEEYAGNGYWWLRSPGGFGRGYASSVNYYGHVSRLGGCVGFDDFVARVALHLNLSSASGWSYAGTVTSDGTEESDDTLLRNPSISSDGVTTWDCVYFGNYWQEDTNGDGTADKNDAKTPIKWRVLSVDGDDAFLLADQNLDCQTYNDTQTAVTWETCTMRSWLNGYGAEENQDGKDYSDDNFLNNAFSRSEQSAISTTRVVNDDNPAYGTEGGNDTSDKVYLLSFDEVTNPAYGFSSYYSKNDEARRAKNTEYAKKQGAVTDDTSEEYAGNGYWWLRSPGYDCAHTFFVFMNGSLSRYGDPVDNHFEAVRPALHLNLKALPDAGSSSNWTYAGTVTSDGKVEKPGSTSTPKPSASAVPGEFTGTLKNPMTDADGTVTWDCVYFGNYWQEDTNGDGKADKNDAKTPIKWRVLSVDGDDVFLLADKNLDCQSYNETNTDVTWQTCTMRSWLNGYGAEENQDGKDYSDDNFLDNVFSRSEQSAISTTRVVNNDNPAYGTEGGNDTSDKVYLLSIDEVTNPAYGFSSDSDEARRAKNTQYAKEQGTLTDTSEEYAGNGVWWLRSPGADSSHASDVSGNGYVGWGGYGVYYGINAARVALHLNLSFSSNWTYAGTVTSDGKAEEPGSTSTLKPSASAAPTGQPDVPPTATPGEFTGKLKNPTTDSDGTVTWDCVYFGNYWQDDTNGDGKADKNDAKTPIKWRVLSVDGDDVFLLADKNLDCQKYNDTYTDVTWETCTMRSWLNGYGAEKNQDGKDYSDNNFLNNAFSPAEQSAIKITNVVNNDNPVNGMEGGNDTFDKMYLLSIDEVTNPAYGFTSSTDSTKTREAVNTAYVAGGGEVGLEGWMADAGSAGYWWLRSPGDESNCASDVSNSGLLTAGWNVDTDDEAVRPALHLNLKASSEAGSSSNWSYAGTVTSDGKVEEPGSTSTPKPSASAAPTGQPDVPPTATPGEFTGKLKNPTTDADGTVTWDCVYFGNYWQEDTNGDGKADKNDAKTPIKWRVLSVDGDDAFLVADKNLDCQSFNDTFTEVTWETCTMRSWLNGYGAEANQDGKDYRENNFLDNAFSKSEQSVIRNTNVVNDGNREFEVEGREDTVDKVYLLSIDEVTNPAYGFASSINSTKTREAVNTAYVADGGEVKSSDTESAGSSDAWWLRSPGDLNLYAAYGGEAGYGGLYGVCVHLYCTVRPALHLNLKAMPDAVSDTSWSYAGSVVSEGGETGTVTPQPTQTPEPQVTEEPTATPTEKPSAEPSAGATPTVTPGEFTGKLKNPAKDADGTVTWDCVYFGNYWQEDTNGDGKADKSDAKTPIKWRVLSVNGDDAFLLADQNLDCQLYNDTNTDVTWETCTMRSWLNGYGANANKDGKNYGGNNFLRNAFSETEQAAIKTTKVLSNDNPEYGTEGGKDTSDKVYLLSIEEVTNPAYGFLPDSEKYDKTKRAKNTEYAKTHGAYTDPDEECAGNGWWWLRSPGYDSSLVSYVHVTGFVNRFGDNVGPDPDHVNAGKVVRPALHLNLKALSDDKSHTIWSYAGTVTAEGSAETEEPSETDKPSTPTPGTPSQPGTSFVMPPAPQPVSPAAPESGVSSDAGKSAVGKVTALKIKQKKRTVTLSWKKQIGAKGYQICYSMSRKWKGKKQKLVTKNNAVIKNLKKNKTYYFRVRVYRREGTKKVYGAWSSVKKIRIKK